MMTFRQLNLFVDLANERVRAMHGDRDTGPGRGKPKL
jgi:hypothetical protein